MHSFVELRVCSLECWDGCLERCRRACGSGGAIVDPIVVGGDPGRCGAYVVDRLDPSEVAKTKGKVLRCFQCRAVAYCGKRCQKIHWKKVHRFTCTPEDSAEGLTNINLLKQERED